MPRVTLETVTGWVSASPTGKRKEHMQNAYDVGGIDKKKIKHDYLLNSQPNVFICVCVHVQHFQATLNGIFFQQSNMDWNNMLLPAEIFCMRRGAMRQQSKSEQELLKMIETWCHTMTWSPNTLFNWSVMEFLNQNRRANDYERIQWKLYWNFANDS